MRKLGITAAFVNAILSIVTLFVVFFMIGVDAITDNQKIIDLAINNPTPLIIEDIFKFFSAAITCVFILTFGRILDTFRPKLMLVANIFGFASVLCLFANAILSLYAISQAKFYTLEIETFGNQLNFVISLLAVGVMIFNGLWYLLISWLSLESKHLPQFFCYLGLGMGVISLIPPLGVFVLILSILWSVWLGKLLLENKSAAA